MAKNKSKKTLNSAGLFNLGREAAEQDPLVLPAFFEHGAYITVESRAEPSLILVGRTGAGKSAIFAQLRSKQPDRVISIRPSDMSLPYLTNSDVIHQLIENGIQLDSFFTTLWKHVIIVEIIQHRYKIDSEVKQMNVISQLLDSFRGNPGKTQSLEYVKEYGAKFWSDTDERVKQIVDEFCERVTADQALSAQIGGSDVGVKASLGGSSGVEHRVVSTVETSKRYKSVVEAAQITKINNMIAVLNDDVLDDQHFTYLVIDDLDREWVDDSLRGSLIRCLLECVLDMAYVKNLKIVVAMRSNILHQLRYSEQKRGPQQEKIEQMIHRLHWTEPDLRDAMESRVAAASSHYKVSPPLTLRGLLPNSNPHRGDPFNYILERTLMRPRDVIMYLNEAIKQSERRRQLAWDHIRSAEDAYSRKRMDALRDEWKDPFFGIDNGLMAFQHAPSVLTQDRLIEYLLRFGERMATDTRYSSLPWVAEYCSAMWESPKEDAHPNSCYQDLVRLLYTIGFLGIDRGKGKPGIYIYNDVNDTEEIDFTVPAKYIIHPAFRPHLRCQEPSSKS